MRYGGLTLYPQAGTLMFKDSKVVTLLEYPRLDQVDSRLMQLAPGRVMCTLIVDAEGYLALKLMDRTHTENDLYVDKYGLEAHYYRRVTLELGEEKPQEGVPRIMLVSATFTCLDPHLYDAVTGEVVY